MKIRFFVLLVNLVLISATRLAAQQLTVDSLIAHAIDNDYSVKVLEEELQRSFLDIKLNKAARLPVISTNLWNESTNGRFYDPLSNQYTTSRTFVSSAGISATWDVFNGGYTNIKSDVDQVGAEIRRLTLRQRKKDIAKEVAALYADVMRSAAVQKILDEEIALYAVEVRRLNELLLQKKITFADLSSVVVNKQRIEEKKYAAEYDMDLNFHQLGLLTGKMLTIRSLSSPDSAYLSALPPDVFFLSVRDSAALKQLSTIYSIKDLQTKKAALTTDLRATDARMKIKIGAGVYSGYSTNRLVYNSETNSTVQAPLVRQLGDNTYEAITVNFFLPVYDRRNRITLRQTAVDERIARLERDDVERKVVFKYEMAKKELTIKHKRFEITQRELTNEQSIFESFQERFNAERLVKRDLFLARQHLLEAKIDYWNSYFDLYKTTRMFMIDYLEQPVF